MQIGYTIQVNSQKHVPVFSCILKDYYNLNYSVPSALKKCLSDNIKLHIHV